MNLDPLPIDEHLDSAAQLLEGDGRVLIVEAPPGAGKTTRLPSRLLCEKWCSGRVLVSEPRRIAARLAATRVAEERRCRLGEEVGYRVRFDEKATDSTRLIYMTEGLVLRRLLGPDGLKGVSAIVLDEVHERSGDLDVLLALLKDAKKGAPELRLILMSATLDAAHLVEYLPEAKLLTSKGRSFDVEVKHQPKEDDRPLAIQVRSAVKEAAAREGDILVFLPGGAEIRACEDALQQVPNVDVLPLHGDLPLQQQVRVLEAHGGRRRVVLSTNVAESSVTIPGVTTVIDSGLARTALFDRWSGVSRLETIRISQARCEQRAGRAGRVAPGQALRLFTKGEFSSRPSQDEPELLRSDLSATLLLLLASDKNRHQLDFVTPPEESAWTQAEELLTRLGALDRGALTEVGRQMAQLPLPPRLSRVTVAGQQHGVCSAACRAAALLAERDIVLSARNFRPGARDVVTSDSDVEDRLERLEQLEDSGFDRRLARDLDLDVRGARQVCKVAQSLERNFERADNSNASDSHLLLRALLEGFTDRVAERRGKGRQLVFSSGTQAQLHESSSVSSAQLLLALSADAPGGRMRQAQVRIACRLEPDFLLDAAPDEVETVEEYVWNTSRDRVEAVSRLTFGKVTLDESRNRAQPSPEAAKLLVRAALAKGPAVYDPASKLETLLIRLRLLSSEMPEVRKQCSEEEQERLSALEVDGMASENKLVEIALETAAQTRTSLEELATADLSTELEHSLPSPVTRALARGLPGEIQLKGGRKLQVHYEKGKDPWVQSRLQDFFSMDATPSICEGRLALSLHLLAPNQRAVQVTKDLPGFWDRHYPELRKQLMRRYPKHLWPEDGRAAKPPQPGRIR